MELLGDNSPLWLRGRVEGRLLLLAHERRHWKLDLLRCATVIILAKRRLVAKGWACDVRDTHIIVSQLSMIVHACCHLHGLLEVEFHLTFLPASRDGRH